MIQFEQEICGDVDASSRREWLETNGLGGFASSTITGLNTRRYHGLLVAATKPPVGRVVLLSKLEETLFIDGQPLRAFLKPLSRRCPSPGLSLSQAVPPRSVSRVHV